MRILAIMATAGLAGCAFGPVSPFSVEITAEITIARAHGVLADGTDAALVTVRVADSLGVPVEGYPVSVALADGGPGTVVTPTDSLTDATAEARASITSATAGLFHLVVTLGTGERARVLAQRPSVRFVAERSATLEMTPHAAVPMGAQPTAVALADCTGDGILDLVTADRGGVSMTLRPGAGDGSFALPSSVALPSEPRTLVLSDLDGDGSLDAVLALPHTDQIAVLFGNGDGTFQDPPALVGTGRFPRALALGDLTGDGLADAVVAAANDRGVALLLGTGVRSTPFLQHAAMVTGLSPADVAVGDFDGDGDADVAVANAASNTVSILVGDGSGGLSATPALAVEEPSSIAAADLNGDGAVDLVVGSAAVNRLLIFVQSAGGLDAVTSSVDTGPRPLGVAIGDLNGDGVQDVVSADAVAVPPTSHTVTIWLGAGDGSFEGRTALPTGESPVAVALGDVDANGSLDLAVANYAAGTVQLFLDRRAGD